MTKEARTAKPVRATKAEWAEIDRVRGAKSLQEFMLEAALGVARGELGEKPARATKGRAKQPAKVAPVKPMVGWNRVTSLRGNSAPRPKGHE
jgi:hypothetical protein